MPNESEQDRSGNPANEVDPLWLCIALAGIGGTLPTLSRLAASLIGSPNAGMPIPSFYLGLGIYFVIGAVMCCALKERALKGALFAGIAAPAVILSGSYGLNDGDKQKGGARAPAPQIIPSPSTSAAPELMDLVVPRANAQASRTGGAGCVSDVQPHGPATAQAAQHLEYRVNIDWSGDKGWDMGSSSNAWVVHVVCAQGDSYLQLNDLSPFSFTTSSAVKEFQLNSFKGRQRADVLPNNSGGVIQMKVEVRTRKDVFWALGGKGIPRVQAYSMEFKPTP